MNPPAPLPPVAKAPQPGAFENFGYMPRRIWMAVYPPAGGGQPPLEGIECD